MIGSIFNITEANLTTPFDYQTNGVEIIDYKLDFKDIEIILEVESQPPGLMEISFERDFFDSAFQGDDEKFTILADGDLVYYNEIQTTPEVRTIKFNVAPNTELVEIFGSNLLGHSLESTPIMEDNDISPIVDDKQSDKIDQLLTENEKLRQENQILVEENKVLDKRIFELENLVTALETEVNKLNALVTEQVKVIYNWVIGNALN